MKKNISVLCIISLVLFTLFGCSHSAYSGIDLDVSNLTDDELFAVQREIEEEINSRVSVNTVNTVTADPSQPNDNSDYSVSPVEDFLYASNGSEIQINAYVGKGGTVVIPDSIEGVPVTALADSAFGDIETSVTSLALPSNLKTIGSLLFAFSDTLRGTIVLPATLQQVGAHAFQGTSITGLVIQSDCDLQLNCFANTNALEFVYIRDGVAPRIDQSVFGSSPNLKIMVIPASVSDIDDDNFDGCNYLKIITPEGSFAQEYAKCNFITCETESYNEYVAYYENLYFNS